MFTPRIIAPLAALLLTLGVLLPVAPVSASDDNVAGAPSTVCGDSDGNHIVNSIDVVIVLQYSAGLIDQLLFFENDDVNSSHTVDALDAGFILQVSARILHIEALHCS